MVGSQGMLEEFENAGMSGCLIDSSSDPTDLLEKNLENTELAEGVTHVLVGFDSKFSHSKGKLSEKAKLHLGVDVLLNPSRA